MSEPCLLCGHEDPLGLALCADCGGTAPAVADRLVFVMPTSRRRERRELRNRIATLLDLPQRIEPLDAASRGLRALARVPGPTAPALIKRLEEAGIPAGEVMSRRAWASVPLSFLLLAAAALGAGVWAGMSRSTPFLFLTTPFIALLIGSAVRRVAEPLYPREPGSLPSPGFAAVFRVLVELPAGPGRDLLADLARAARRVGGPGAGLDPRLVARLEALLPEAASAARDLAMLDESLVRFSPRAGPAAPPDALRRGLDDLRRVRVRLEAYLLEATGLVGSMQSLGADAVDSAGDRLMELTAELRADVAGLLELEPPE